MLVGVPSNNREGGNPGGRPLVHVSQTLTQTGPGGKPLADLGPTRAVPGPEVVVKVLPALRRRLAAGQDHLSKPRVKGHALVPPDSRAGRGSQRPAQAVPCPALAPRRVHQDLVPNRVVDRCGLVGRRIVVGLPGGPARTVPQPRLGVGVAEAPVHDDLLAVEVVGDATLFPPAHRCPTLGPARSIPCPYGLASVCPGPAEHQQHPVPRVIRGAGHSAAPHARPGWLPRGSVPRPPAGTTGGNPHDLPPAGVPPHPRPGAPPWAPQRQPTGPPPARTPGPRLPSP